MASRKGAAAVAEFTGHVRRWEKRWVKPDASKPNTVFKWVPAGADTRTDEERLAKRRKYVPESVPPIADLEAYLPAAGWPSEKAAAVPAEPEAPRRSLRARTERTYVDGEDDDFDERSVSDDEPPPPRPAAGVAPASAAAPAQPVALPPQQPAPPQPVQPVAPQPVAPQPAPPA